MNLKKNLFSVIMSFLFLFINLTGSAQDYSNVYKKMHSNSIEQDKNFYLLTAFDQVPGINDLLTQNAELKKVKEKKFGSVEKLSECTSAKCHADKFIWSDDEIGRIGNTLHQLTLSNSEMKMLVKNQLRPSGKFEIYSKLADEDLLQQAWEDAAKGINHIIEVYAIGLKPMYPAIDSVSYLVTSKAYHNIVNEMSGYVSRDILTQTLFKPSLQFALTLLEINNRDEASRFEPLEATENKAAYSYIKTVDWTKFKYSIMLIPGAGNDLPNVSLSAFGKIRAQIAVDRYKAGVAPLIVVSGGYVHPFQTPYCEAIEMKKYLMQKYQIPEKAILIDPHARHTTTNIRNTVRLIYQYGIPPLKKALIVTTVGQSKYIEDPKFKDRCQKEMKCVPFSNLNRTSIYDLEFIPSIDAMYHYSIDPLDP